MADEFLEEADSRRRVGPWRVVLASLAVVALLTTGLLYHDGLIAVSDVAEAREHETPYRLRGTVGMVDEQGFTLAGDGASLRVLWNLTAPVSGATVIVSGVYNATASALEGDAVVRAYVFQ